MLPGIGVTINGATRWLGAGPLQFQPSELLKVALVLYAAQLLAARPGSVKRLGTLAKPLLLVVGAACAAAAQAARHGHGDGHLLRDRRAADRRRHADAAPRHPGRRAVALAPAMLAMVEPYRMARADGLPRPVRGRRRHRLPGGAGDDRDRLGRALRRRPRRVGAEDLLPARGAHGHDPGDHRRGARAWSASPAWPCCTG